MLGVLAGLLLLAMLAQFLLAVWVHRDASRRELEQREMYTHGTLAVPLFGLLVFGMYLSRRDELPQREGPPDLESDPEEGVYRVSQPAALDGWTLQLACVLATRRWLLWVILASPVLLALALVYPRVGGAYFSLTVACLVVALFDTGRYGNATVRVDESTRTVTVSGEGRVTGRAPFEHEVNLEGIDDASFTRLADLALVRLDSEKPFAAHRFAVPAADVESFAERLAGLGVDVPRQVRLAGLSPERGVSSGRATAEVSLVVVLGAVVPLVLAALRPRQFLGNSVGLILVVMLAWWVLSRLRHALGVWSTRGSADDQHG